MILMIALVITTLLISRNILWGTSSKSILLVQVQSGTVIAQKNAKASCDPASLTKMMTVLLAVEELPELDELVTLPEEIFTSLYAENASMAGFCPGETVTVRDLLYGAMLPSGAECCVALALRVCGSEEVFVTLMNQKAQELGMTQTHFCNPTGLTDEEHKSTAADLAILLRAALQNSTFRMIFTTARYTTSQTMAHPEGLLLSSTLLSKLDGNELTNGKILGGKTGYTSEAGLCLASLAEIGGQEYILITLGAPGNHSTVQYHIQDAITIYTKLENKGRNIEDSTTGRLFYGAEFATMKPQGKAKWEVEANV